MLNVITALNLVRNPSHAKDPRPFVQIMLNNTKRLTTLVDSGSEISALDYNVFKSSFPSRSHFLVEPVPFPLVGANGLPLDIVGQVMIPIELEKEKFKAETRFILIRNLNSKCILGADFLQTHRLILDYSSAPAKLTKYSTKSENLVTMCEEVKIPAMSERVVKVKCAKGGQDLLLSSLGQGISDSIISVNSNKMAKVLWQNKSCMEVSLKRNEVVGKTHSLANFQFGNDTSWTKKKESSLAQKELLSQVRLDHLPPDLRRMYTSVISQFPSIFSLDPTDIGNCPTLPQTMVMKDPHKIVSIPPYRTAPHLQPVVKHYVNTLLNTGVIQRSTSPFCSPLLLVRKAGAKTTQPLVEQFRVVHDYRKLNENTVRDAYPLHNLYDLLDKVAAAKVWSVLDLSSGFWNQQLDPQSRRYTAFAIPGMGHFEYTRSAQGLCNSPAAFQRLLDFVVRDIPGVYVYIDDVVVCSDSHESHARLLEEVFKRFQKYNLKCRPHKIQIATAEINYLGYNLSHNKGIRPGAAKTQAISAWNPPQTVKEIRQFLGLCSFFRRTIPKFSSIASPLTKLTRKDSPWKSGELPHPALLAFNELKSKLIQRPCLQPPDFNKRFFLTIDASTTGLGAILSQKRDNVEHPVAFASRTLTPSEEKYAPFHLEYLAMVWAAKHFKPYLIGQQFTMRTDHKPLVSLNKTKSQAFDRYLLELANFDYTVEYLSGNKMPADALSRKLEEVTLVSDLQKQINFSWSQIKQLQQNDKEIKALAVFLMYNSLPTNEGLQEFVKRNSNAVIHQGVVCYPSPHGPLAYASKGIRSTLLRMAHDEPTAGHMGWEKTLSRLKHWYWPNKTQEVKWHCQSCQKCLQLNRKWSNAPAPMGRLPVVEHFNERVHIDLLGPLPVNNNCKYVMIIVDAYSKFLQLVPLPDKQMVTTSQAFYDHWITLFSVPNLVVSDLGLEFHNKLFSYMAQSFGFSQQFSAPQHPASNGSAEAQVRTVLSYIRKFVTDSNEWLSKLQNIRFMHNTTVHSSIQTTPFQAAFAKRPSLPLDLIFPPSSKEKAHNVLPSHVQNEINDLVALKRHVLTEQNAAYQKAKVAFDKRAKQQKYQVGDKIFLRRPHSGKMFQKFQPLYKGVYVVVGVSESELNLRVVPFNGPKNKIQVVHVQNCKLAPAAIQFFSSSHIPAERNREVPSLLPSANPDQEMITRDPHPTRPPQQQQMQQQMQQQLENESPSSSSSSLHLSNHFSSSSSFHSPSPYESEDSGEWP